MFITNKLYNYTLYNWNIGSKQWENIKTIAEQDMFHQIILKIR